MADNYVMYFPFEPSNYNYFDTVNNKHLYIKKEISDSSSIILYKNKAEINRVNKTSFIEYVDTINGVYRDLTSITEITVTLEYNKFIDFNYVYIPIFNRYYFVTDVRISNYSLYEIDLTVDVLMSYKNAILNLNAFIDRNENTTNPMLLDKKRVIEQGIDVEVIEIENDVFLKDGETFQTETDLMYVINGYKIESSDTLAQ